MSDFKIKNFKLMEKYNAKLLLPQVLKEFML